MPIVSSAIVEDAVQHDGRRAIREVHVDHTGMRHHIYYLASAAANASATLTARVPVLEEYLAARELEANLNEVLG